VEAAAAMIAEGLRARLAYREAAGWLAYSHVWIHPRDLALRDAGLTNTYAAAFAIGQLEAALPATTSHGFSFEVAPSDYHVGQALKFARLWRRLAELRTWQPLANAAALEETQELLGCGGSQHASDIDDWLASINLREEGPALIRAARAARAWMNLPHQTKPLTHDGVFLAACMWRRSGFGQSLSLPFWLAPEPHLLRLANRTGIQWVADFLDCVAEAAKKGLAELDRLQTAAAKADFRDCTKRSKLPAAFDAVMRSPVITARGLADRLEISSQAALGLLQQLTDAGIIREATGRSSFRAFVTV
jgi:HTH DNA binding domain